MSDPHDNPNAPVPWMQQLLDNPFLLLFLGVAVPMVLYTFWGVYDILTLPLAKGSIASYLGTVHETLSRTFARLIRERVVAVHGNKVTILDKKKLADLV